MLGVPARVAALRLIDWIFNYHVSTRESALTGKCRMNVTTFARGCAEKCCLFKMFISVQVVHVCWLGTFICIYICIYFMCTYIIYIYIYT